MKKIVWITLMTLLFAINIPASAVGETKRIAVVTPYMANATTAYVIKQFKKDAEGYGWKVSVSDTAGDFGLLVSRIEDAVNQNVDAIVLGMGDPVQMTKGLAAASAKGIPVFGLDAGYIKGVHLNVTSDNTSLGQISAEALVAAINKKGQIIMFTHDPHPGVRERAVGAANVFKKYPGLTVINKSHIKVPGPVENARKLTEDLLTTHKGEIIGIWAGWDEPAYGATQAIEAAGRTGTVKVVGIDGTDFAKDEINNGEIFAATVEQDFNAMAKILAKMIADYFAGKPPESKVYKISGKLYKK